MCDFAELKKRQVFSLVFYSCNDNKNKHSKTQQPCSLLNAHRRGNAKRGEFESFVGGSGGKKQTVLFYALTWTLKFPNMQKIKIFDIWVIPHKIKFQAMNIF